MKEERNLIFPLRVKSKTQIKHKDKLYKYASKLKQKATPEEKELYSFLQKLPYRLYFQKVLPPYIVDFLVRHILIIELDGKQHENNIEYDSYRDNYLKRYGFEILRFSNTEFRENKKEVLGLIVNVLKAFPKNRVQRAQERANRVCRDYATNWSLWSDGERSRFRHKNYEFDKWWQFKHNFATELKARLNEIF